MRTETRPLQNAAGPSRAPVIRDSLRRLPARAPARPGATCRTPETVKLPFVRRIGLDLGLDLFDQNGRNAIFLHCGDGEAAASGIHRVRDLGDEPETVEDDTGQGLESC